MRGKTVKYILHKHILGYLGNQQKATDQINNRLNKQQKTTDFQKQQISKTADFKKQQISKNRFQKQQLKNNRLQRNHIFKNNRFQKTTNFKLNIFKNQVQIDRGQSTFLDFT